MHTITIRKVEKTEVIELQTVGKATFFETFINDCTSSDMEKYLEEKHNLDLLRAELENIESHFYFAIYEGKIVGYLKLNQGNAQTEKGLDNALEIERIYVLAKFQGKKIGQLLMNTAFEKARNEGFKWLWLGVWEHNLKAIRFYEKNNFVIFGSHPFMLGTDKQTDVLMKLDIESLELNTKDH